MATKTKEELRSEWIDGQRMTKDTSDATSVPFDDVWDSLFNLSDERQIVVNTKDNGSGGTIPTTETVTLSFVSDATDGFAAAPEGIILSFNAGGGITGKITADSTGVKIVSNSSVTFKDVAGADQNITVLDPTSLQHAATKNYVDTKDLESFPSGEVDGTYSVVVAAGGVTLASGGGTGNVSQLGGAVGDDTIATFDGTGGFNIQDSVVTISPGGNITTTGNLSVATITATGNIIVSGDVDGVDIGGLNAIVGGNTTDISTHVADLTNPHDTTIANLNVGGTLADLNTALGGTTIDESTDSRPPDGAAAGDLGGTYPNPKVAAITEITAAVDTQLTLGSIPDGEFLVRAGTTIIGQPAGGGGSPTGAAGGDLTGTYPNPDLATTTVLAGSYTNSDITVDAKGRLTAAANGAGGGGAPTGPAGGDLGGTYPNPSVAAITTTTGPTQLTVGAVADGQFLVRSGPNLIGSVPAGSGDVVGPGVATDNAIAIFDGATGKTIQNSGIILDATSGGDRTIINFGSGAAPASETAGTLFYDNNTLNAVYDQVGPVLQIGQENWIRVEAGEDLLDGDVVYVSDSTGPGVDALPIVSKARSDVLATSNVVGVATQAILSGAEGFITAFGIVRELDLNDDGDGVALVDGDTLYLSSTTAGQWVKTEPKSPNFPVIVGQVINAQVTQGTLLVQITESKKTNDIGGVGGMCIGDAKVLADGDILSYNLANQRFQNIIPVSGGGFTVGKTLYVDSLAAGPGALNDPADAFITIKTAITAVVGTGTTLVPEFDGYTIIVAPGSYPEDALYLPDNTSLVSTGGWGQTTIGPAPAAAVSDVLIMGENCYVNGFSFRVPGGAPEYYLSAIVASQPGGGPKTNGIYNCNLLGDGGALLSTGTGIYRSGGGKTIGGNIRVEEGGMKNCFKVDQGVLALEGTHVPESSGSVVSVLEVTTLAQYSLKITGGNFANDDTVLIDSAGVAGTEPITTGDSFTYIFKTAPLAGVPGSGEIHVLLGVTAQESLENLVAAITNSESRAIADAAGIIYRYGAGVCVHNAVGAQLAPKIDPSDPDIIYINSKIGAEEGEDTDVLITEGAPPAITGDVNGAVGTYVSGAAVNLILSKAGRAQMVGYNSGKGAAASLTNNSCKNCVNILGGTAALIPAAIIFTPNIFNCTTAVSADGKYLSMSLLGGRIENVTTVVHVTEPTLTQAQAEGAKYRISSNHQPTYIFPPAAGIYSDFVLNYAQETSDTLDSSYNIFGPHHLSFGFPERGTAQHTGRGAPYISGMFVVQDDGTTLTDKSVEAASKDSSTFSFGAAPAAADALYIGSYRQGLPDGISQDFLKHWGVEAFVATRETAIGTGSYVFERWVGGAWTAFQTHTSSRQEGYSYAQDNFWRSAADEVIRYGLDSASVWDKVPLNFTTAMDGPFGGAMSADAGVNILYWIRIRVVTAPGATYPQFERFKLLESSSNFSKNGRQTLTGLAQYKSTLFGTGNTWGDGVGMSDTNENNISNLNWVQKNKKSRFGSSGDNNTFQFVLPGGLCTAFPVSFKLSVSTPTGSTLTNANMTMSALPLRIEGTNIADEIGGAIVPVPRLFADADDYTAAIATTILKVDEVIPLEKIKTMTFSYDFSDYYEDDIILLNIMAENGSGDNISPTNAIDMWTLEIEGVSWTPGKTL